MRTIERLRRKRAGAQDSWRYIAITLIAMTIGAESGAEQEDLIRRKAAV
jgi:hypothetical protein